MASLPALKHNPIIPVLALLWIENPSYGKFLWNEMMLGFYSESVG